MARAKTKTRQPDSVVQPQVLDEEETSHAQLSTIGQKHQKHQKQQQPSAFSPEPADLDLDSEEAEDSPDDLEIRDREIVEKDAVEEELERAVFGDSVGFRQGLRDYDPGQYGLGAQGHDARKGRLSDGEDADEDDEDHAAMSGLQDAELFFTDTLPGDQAPLWKDGTESDDAEHAGRRAVWEDSEDERLVVSLASVPRLRKLRRTEAENLVTGKEYARRLRKQYELLNPVPEWATHAIQGPPKHKKRRLSNSEGPDGEVSSADEMDVDENDDISAEPLAQLLRSSTGLVRRSEAGPLGKKRKLRPEVVDIQRLKDIEGIQPSAITSLSFHPSLPLLLSSGPSSTLYLHHIVSSPPAPSANPLLTSVHIKGSPLSTSAFHPHDARIFLSARRRYFHVWTLSTGRVEKITRVYGQQQEQRSMERFKLSPDGKWMALLGTARKGGGLINLLDAHTLQWSSQIRIESRGGIADFEWWSDARGLCIAGKNGEMTEWNLAAQRAVARWQDEGAVGTTTISLGGSNGHAGAEIGIDRWIAVGSSSGIVNIYDRRAWLAGGTGTGSGGGGGIPDSHPKPTRTLDHLTTPTSHLVFSPDGQLLVMASRWKKDALRIIHLPTCTVYKNWPTANTPLGRITGAAFGPGSDVLAVANEAGKIRMWEIRA